MRNSAVRAATVAGIMCALSAAQVLGQVNSGSDGHDGALNPASNLVIDMADHPDGIYQYTSVNIPSGVTVSFTPNAANTPVVWLVQGSCTIAGSVSVDGNLADSVMGATGGPGAFRGGNGTLGGGVDAGGPGFGPGGGRVTPHAHGGNASYGTLGGIWTQYTPQSPAGDMYGSSVILPLIGGSGGAGSCVHIGGGGGGGGAILVVVNNSLVVSGSITAKGGNGFASISPYPNNTVVGGGGGGSGGSIRVIATTLGGTGSLRTDGGLGVCGYNWGYVTNTAGQGRIRLEAFSDTFTGPTVGVATRGLTGIIMYPANQEPRIAISSVAGVPIPVSPGGVAATPDVLIPAQQGNPISIVVACQNTPLNSDIIVDVKPYNGVGVTATAQNSTGTVAASTATISINMPTGGGTIQARTTANIVIASAKDGRRTPRKPSLFETGLAMNGERFKAAEITSKLGGRQQLVFVTESGKRIAASASGRERSERKPSTQPS